MSSVLVQVENALALRQRAPAQPGQNRVRQRDGVGLDLLRRALERHQELSKQVVAAHR